MTIMINPEMDLLSSEANLTVHQIKEYICIKYRLTMDELVGDRRSARIARPRQEGYWLASKLTGCSLAQIGAYFGGRDHTTILHGIRRHEERLGAGV